MEQQEKKESLWKSIWSVLRTAYTMFTCLAILVCLSTATYAWFTANSIVTTDRVSGKADTDQVMLQVSQTGGENFAGAAETGIVQVNHASSGDLLPVSTADLKNFVYSPGTIGEEAVSFLKVENEKYYYHGRIYLRATAEGHSENARLALYLDGAELNGAVAKNVHGYLANAARLGFLFDGSSARILRVSEESNPEGSRILNTKLNGEILKAGQVIDSTGDTLRATADPSEALAAHMVGADGLVTGSGVSPLLWMELNRIYMVDIFFYLEGCDPDCSDVTRMDALDLHLAFYGVLMEGEG